MKTCFVISPIGPEGSDVRKNADDLYDLIIEPALEIFDFKVVRGDKLLTVSAITDDIINYIQNSELCVIDLTGHNPNVFYECGRRHESARPYIHMKKKGEQIPFDISGIRTLDYDLSDGRKIKESIDYLRKFISELENTGYSSQSSTFSLNNLASTLTRIERKIDNLSIDNLNDSSPGGGGGGAEKAGDDPGRDPYRAYWDYLQGGEYGKATAALRRFMNINYDSSLHLDLCTYLTDAYEPSAVLLSRNLLDTKFDTLKMSIVAIALDSLTRYYNAAMTLEEEYSTLKNYLTKALEKCETDKDKGGVYHVFSTLEYYLKNDLKALDYQKKAAELYESGPVLYNLAKLYETCGKEKDMVDTLDNYIYLLANDKMKPGKEEIRFLEYAKRQYEKVNMPNKASQVDALMQKISQLPAGTVRNN